MACEGYLALFSLIVSIHIMGTNFFPFPHSFGQNEIILCAAIVSSIFYGVLVLIVKNLRSQEALGAANKLFHSSGYFIFCSLIHGMYLAYFYPHIQDNVIPTTDFVISICFPVVFALTHFSSISSGNHQNHEIIAFVLLIISLLSLILCSLRMNPHLFIWPTTSICIILDIFLIVQINHCKKIVLQILGKNTVIQEEAMNLESGLPRMTVEGAMTDLSGSVRTTDGVIHEKFKESDDAKYMIQIMANIAHDLKTVRSINSIIFIKIIFNIY
jgi:hypothetical protein